MSLARVSRLSRLSLLKRKLRGGPKLSPFLVLGDPTPELSLALARAAVAQGASMLEIGFPYSDPVADGPAIQGAVRRAFAGGTSTNEAMRILGRIAESCPHTDLNLLVYGNLVHARGLDRFTGEVVDAGASSLLVPDIPLEESGQLKRACKARKLGHVQLVGPLTAGDRLKRLDRAADAFLYLVARQNVTGVAAPGGADDFAPVAALVERTVAAVSKPLCLGFGLSKPEQVKRGFDAGARIAVVGSHLAEVIDAAWTSPEGGDEETLVREFVGALRPLVAVASAS